MGWGLGLAANAVVAVAYLAIATVIAVALSRSGQLRSNPLGAATAAIFVTCAVHHGSHSVHMAMPWLGPGAERGLALRASYDVTMATWDVVTAAVGVYYWSLRRSYAPMMRGAKLFDDVQQREQQALELNDNVLQGLVVARLALDLGHHDKAREALEKSIASAGAIIGDLLEADRRPASAGLLRSSPALQPRPARSARAARPAPEEAP